MQALKELRDELQSSRDEIDRLNALLADMAPRSELEAARRVSAHVIYIYIYYDMSCNLWAREVYVSMCVLDIACL